ncbi:MAG: cupin domain-containing protein [Mycobacterium sp.]|nr:cupin domain-containing protein [Mycobacterium sp.]
MASASAMLGKSMSPFIVRPAGRTVRLEYGDRTIGLDAGCSASFDASVNHNFRSVGEAVAEVLSGWVVAGDDLDGYRR